jgi:hypothetical protein
MLVEAGLHDQDMGHQRPSSEIGRSPTILRP